MRIEFELTPDECASEFLRLFAIRNPGKSVSWSASFLTAAIAAGVAFALSHELQSRVMSAIIAGAVALISHRLMFRQSFKRRMTRFFHEKMNNQPETYIAETTERGLTAHDSVRALAIPWSNVESIVKIPTSIDFYIVRGEWATVPRSAFETDEDFDEFFVRRRCFMPMRRTTKRKPACA